MKNLKDLLTVVAMSAIAMVIFVGSADAQRRSQRETRDAIRSINSKIDDFSSRLKYRLESSSTDEVDIGGIMATISDLRKAMIDFDDNFNNRRENRDDVYRIYGPAKEIDEFMVQNPQTRSIENAWSDLKKLLDDLGAKYNASWRSYEMDGNNATTGEYSPTVYRGTSGSVSTSALTGTYRLDASQSEDAERIADEIGVTGSNRQDLTSKLTSPEQIAIDVRGNNVTLASTNTAPVTFPADGREKTETVNGKTLRVRASLSGKELVVSSLGGESDYTVTFTSVGNGDSLKVSRRITTAYLNETVFADSVYSKSDNVAGLGIDPGALPDDGAYSSNDQGDDRYSTNDDAGYSSNDPNDQPVGQGNVPAINRPKIGQYVVPNGLIITGSLDTVIDTKVSQNNDRFRMTVQSPDEFRGAVVEGFITGIDRGGRFGGRANVTFNFEKITLRDGKAYDFGGYLQSLTDEGGKNVKVDAEGRISGSSQTKETAKRGGIGAGIGAVIGAIAGGGKGAAIGAIIGGGAGAGSVAITGKEDIKLMQGSTLTVQSSSPLK